MKDREFLMWLHERLVFHHNEKSTYDYMHKLRAIIKNMPENQTSINVKTGNNLGELREIISDERRDTMAYTQKEQKILEGYMFQALALVIDYKIKYLQGKNLTDNDKETLRKIVNKFTDFEIAFEKYPNIEYSMKKDIKLMLGEE